MNEKFDKEKQGLLYRSDSRLFEESNANDSKSFVI